MKVVFHEDFYQVYASDPAAAGGRMEAVVKALRPHLEFVNAQPASQADIALVHNPAHIAYVRHTGRYDIAALAAGGAVQAATIGLSEPCFGLIRPPGHHASAGSCWGFCYFNNMAIALEVLKQRGLIESAYVLDIDLHFGDGTVNILGKKDYVTVYNVDAMDRTAYLDDVAKEMSCCQADIIGLSAGFDYHREDWGGLLQTEDYYTIGKCVRQAASRRKGGVFAILEGGYNQRVLGDNVLALIQGLSGQ
ncbi:MAG: histone deacetylase family protein [Desulfobacterales bacterium]|nr:MAG: histone deacetylase family protein [Desulfobacterales bacterium]